MPLDSVGANVEPMTGVPRCYFRSSASARARSHAGEQRLDMGSNTTSKAPLRQDRVENTASSDSVRRKALWSTRHKAGNKKGGSKRQVEKQHRQAETNCFRFACSAEAVLPMGLRLECKGFVVCLSISLNMKLLGRRLRRRPDWREAAA